VLRLYSSVSYLTTVGMCRGDFTFVLSWRAGWWGLILQGGKPEAEAGFGG